MIGIGNKLIRKRIEINKKIELILDELAVALSFGEGKIILWGFVDWLINKENKND